MIPDITQRNILSLIDAFSIYQARDRAHQIATCARLDQFSKEETWLLNFVQYVLFWNRTWKTLDATSYYLVPPAPVQKATFTDFIGVLRHYGSRKVNPKNEKYLVVFLANCAEPFRDFYLDILSRQEWIRGFYTMSMVRNYIDRSLIHPEDIYGELKVFKAQFATLPFPVMVTTIPGDLPSGMIVRSTEIFVYVFKDGEKIRIKNNWLAEDRRFLTEDRFTLLGLIDEERRRFYPTDMFRGGEYQKYLRGICITPYYQRLHQLDDWLAHNYLRQIKRVPKEYVVSPAGIDDAVRRVLAGSEQSTLVFTKENQQRFVSQAKEVKGLIEEVWSEQGVAKGFRVWHNTRLLNCSYSFAGSANALLFRPEVLTARVVRFWLFRFENHKAGAVKEILWDEKPFCRSLTITDGSKVRIEKCAFCAQDSSTVKQKYRGICLNTMCNLQQILGKYGPDTWIKPSWKVEAWREASAWEPYLMNSVGFTYKGYNVVCRESDGYLMFESDPETMREYMAYINQDSKWANWVREKRLKFITPEDLRERFVQRYGEGKRGKGIQGQGEARSAGVPGAPAAEGVDLHGEQGRCGGGGSAGDLAGGEGLRGGGEELPEHQSDRLPEAGEGAGPEEG